MQHTLFHPHTNWQMLQKSTPNREKIIAEEWKDGEKLKCREEEKNQRTHKTQLLSTLPPFSTKVIYAIMPLCNSWWCSSCHHIAFIWLPWQHPCGCHESHEFWCVSTFALRIFSACGNMSDWRFRKIKVLVCWVIEDCLSNKLW